MKKTTAITLTLLSTVALAACDTSRKQRVLAGYRDPSDTTRVSSTRRTGYVPFYRTVYYGSRYNGGSGGHGGGSGYRSGSGGGEGGHVGGVSRGGFGGTGGGHGAGS
jgi:hypothetical protein